MHLSPEFYEAATALFMLLTPLAKGILHLIQYYFPIHK